MMKVSDAMVKQWPHRRRKWFELNEVVEESRVWMIYKRYVKRRRPRIEIWGMLGYR